MPGISFRKRSAVVAIAGAIVAAGYFGYSQYAGREAAARRAEFVRRSTLGNGLVAEGKFGEGIPALKEALAVAPAEMLMERLTVYNNLAGAYTATGKTEEAGKILEEARRFTEGIPESKLNQPEFKLERVRLLMGLADVALAQGKLPEAEALYRRAVKIGPEHGTAHANLANVLFLQGKYAESDSHFDLAMARQPNNPETLCNWGAMLLNYKQPQEAERKFRAALALNSKGARSYHGLGQALRAQGRFGPALQALKTAIHYSPKMAEAFLDIADIYAELKDYRQAELYLRAVLSQEMDPNNLHAIQALARLLSSTPDPEQRNYLESAELYQRVVEMTKGRDVNVLTQLAGTYALAKVYDRAREMIGLAIEQARQQNLSPVDIEVLLQNAQQIAIKEMSEQAGERTEATPTQFTTVGDPLGLGPKQKDPFDAPPPPPKKFSPTELFKLP